MKPVIFFILLALPFFAYSVDIYLTDINFYTEEYGVELNKEENSFTENLYSQLQEEDYEGKLKINIVNTGSDEDVIRSVLDASELCEERQIDYLLYGFVKKKIDTYDSELWLYDHRNNENRKAFYSRSDFEGYDEIAGELSLKVVNYLYIILGLGEHGEEREKSFGGLWIYNSCGYRGILSKWSNSLIGLFNYTAGVSIVPVMPVAHSGNLNFFIRTGFHIAYSLGKNKPDVVEAYLNSIAFRVPLEFCFKIGEHNNIIMGASPQLNLDILSQQTHYDDSFRGGTVAFGLSPSFAYEYIFSGKTSVALGFNNIISFSFYEEPLTTYNVELYLLIGIKRNKE